MNNVERFKNVLRFEKVDKIPVIEWAEWWDKTIEAWHTEGLPKKLTDPFEIREYFNLDRLWQLWVLPYKKDCPKPVSHGAGIAKNDEEYTKIRKYLYPQNPLDEKELEYWAGRQEQGDVAIWFTIDGFFWHPREILGIENHLYAFYDQPDLMHRINSDILEFNINVIEKIVKICTPVFMTFAEDLSYNNGPMLSKNLFNEFMVPYYKKIIPILEKHDIIPFMDSDGEISSIIPWLKEVGIKGILPVERMAGNDLVAIREKYPEFLFIGGVDKTVLHKDIQLVREEFERLKPVIEQGGYIPGVDHQTPPAVSMQKYRDYLAELKKYCSF